MDDLILITQLNDFVFCPVSIYFHRIYGNQDKITYQSVSQINGTHAHNKIDENGQWQLEYKKSSEYAGIFFTEILEHKKQIFLYIREFYRSFMKGSDIEKYKIYKYVSDSIEETDGMRWRNSDGN